MMSQADAVTYAHQYVSNVREIFCHKVKPPQPDVYQAFIKLLHGSNGASIPDIIEKIVDLFIGRQSARELIEGFNAFLPEGYSISFPAYEHLPSITYPPGVTGVYASRQESPVSLEHCNFLKAVNAMFASAKPEKCRLFTELVQRFRDTPSATQAELNLHTALLFEDDKEKLAALWVECGCAGECVRNAKGCATCLPCASAA